MDTQGFHFGRRVEDQVDLLRALVAQGKVDRSTADVCLEELASRARDAKRSAIPYRRWSDRSTTERVGLRDAAPAVAGTTPIPAHQRDPDRRRRLIKHIADTALPVRYAGALRAPDGTTDVPLVVVDGQRRPDVADLPRVFRSENAEAEARSRWLFVLDKQGRGCAVLVVGINRPVRCRFRLLFSMVHDRALLSLVGRASGFVLTCLDPALGRERALYDAMYIAVPGAEVLALLSGSPFGAA